MSPKHTNELIADKVYETWIDSLSPKSALKKLMKITLTVFPHGN